MLLLAGSDRGLIAGLSSGLTGFGAAIADRTLPIVLLQQLRDIADPTRASYQEIIEAPACVVRVHRWGLIPGGFEVRWKMQAGIANLYLAGDWTHTYEWSTERFTMRPSSAIV